MREIRNQDASKSQVICHQNASRTPASRHNTLIKQRQDARKTPDIQATSHLQYANKSQARRRKTQARLK